MQAVAPAAENVPPGQEVHVAASREVEPAGPNSLAEHRPPATVQKALPALLENSPGGHRVHVAAAADEAPRLPLLPAGHAEPPAHEVAPTNEDHVPGGHCSQPRKLEAPRTAKVPGWQMTHKLEGKYGQLHDVAP